MHTSWSLNGLYYGSSFFSYVDNAFRDYVAFINKGNNINYRFKSWNESYGTLTWSKFKSEINRNRPLVFLVDSDGNGNTDHFVTAIGYRDTKGYNQYACRDTWSTGTRWERFRGMSSKYKWGIYGATYFAPYGPIGVSATDGKYCSYVRISWSHAQGATGYTIWRGTTSSSSKATQIASDSSSPYYDRSATPGKRYYYWVKSSFGSATSDLSGYNTGYRRKTGTPTNASASDGTHCTFIRVTWTHTTCATSYEIWRSTSQTSGYKKIGTDSSSPYDDTTGLNPGTKYWYRVRATGLGGTSGFSNSDRGHRPFSQPSHPSNVLASDGSYCGYVRVSWSHVADATSYEIWRSTRSTTAGMRIGTDTASPYYDRNATPGQKYYYRLRTKSICGTSGFSLANSGYRKNCN